MQLREGSFTALYDSAGDQPRTGRRAAAAEMERQWRPRVARRSGVMAPRFTTRPATTCTVVRMCGEVTSLQRGELQTKVRDDFTIMEKALTMLNST